MAYLMRERFQKGDSGALVGNLNFSFRGGFEMDVYSCRSCGRLEFFLPDTEESYAEPEAAEDFPPDADCGIVGVSRDGMPQVRCSACGRNHDFDYPQCPYCGYPQNGR